MPQFRSQPDCGREREAIVNQDKFDKEIDAICKEVTDSAEIHNGATPEEAKRFGEEIANILGAEPTISAPSQTIKSNNSNSTHRRIR
jgi:hypothetical protein